MFASLDWVPTLVDIAGGPKGSGLKEQIQAGKYPGIVKTTLDGVDQRAYLEGTSGSARDTFFYYTGPVPSAVRYKNWKIYFSMEGACATCGLAGPRTYKWAQIDNIRRDPFETAIGFDQETLLGMGGALAGPVTAYIYDWNILPLGQILWLKELETYGPYPPMQDPASYNLSQVMAQIKAQRATSHAGD
jgi:arylsulfatase